MRCLVGRPTSDAAVAGLEVWRKVSLARSYVDQRTHTDVTHPASRTLRVKQRHDVIAAAEVVVATDTPAQPHPPVHRWRHQDDVIRPRARGVEVLRQTVLTNLYTQSCRQTDTHALNSWHRACCPVVKVGGNAWERRSQTRKLCNAAFPGPIEGLFQWERTFLGPKIEPVIVPTSKIL